MADEPWYQTGSSLPTAWVGVLEVQRPNVQGLLSTSEEVETWPESSRARPKRSHASEALEVITTSVFYCWLASFEGDYLSFAHVRHVEELSA